LEKLGPEVVEELDEAYRNRLRALQAVDDIVGTVFEQLEKQGKLDNTYIIYSADNGYGFIKMAEYCRIKYVFLLDIILVNTELIQANVQTWKKISSKCYLIKSIQGVITYFM
jgi:arylsulfatase A-like enzyme